RAHGDVKVAAGFLAGAQRILNQPEKLRRNRHVALCGVAIDGRELALRLVIAHLLIKLVDLCKNLTDHFGKESLVAAIGDYSVNGPHGLMGGLVADRSVRVARDTGLGTRDLGGVARGSGSGSPRQK